MRRGGGPFETHGDFVAVLLREPLLARRPRRGAPQGATARSARDPCSWIGNVSGVEQRGTMPQQSPRYHVTVERTSAGRYVARNRRGVPVTDAGLDLGTSRATNVSGQEALR